MTQEYRFQWHFIESTRLVWLGELALLFLLVGMGVCVIMVDLQPTAVIAIGSVLYHIPEFVWALYLRGRWQLRRKDNGTAPMLWSTQWLIPKAEIDPICVLHPLQ